MTDSAHDISPTAISAYAETHCAICAAGWTRQGADGARVVVCLLDRESVWPDIAGCDRYEPRG